MTVDTEPTDGSMNPITSDAAYELKDSLNTTNQNIASVEATNYASRNYAQYEWLI
jgi:hypothetical protein